MRAAVIFGLGTSSADLKPFQDGSRSEWLHGLPASSGDADAILIFGGDGTIHRHLPALVRLQLPVLIVPAGSGNDFARALNLRSMRDSLRVWRDFESGKIQARAIDLGVIVPSAAPEHTHYFCGVAGCGLDSAAARRANQMPRWLRGHGGYALALLPLLLELPACSMRLTQVNGEDSHRSRKADSARRLRQHAVLRRRHAHRAKGGFRRWQARHLPHHHTESLQTVLHVSDGILRAPSPAARS